VGEQGVRSGERAVGGEVEARVAVMVMVVMVPVPEEKERNGNLPNLSMLLSSLADDKAPMTPDIFPCCYYP
jgi:hypothetical protein